MSRKLSIKSIFLFSITGVVILSLVSSLMLLRTKASPTSNWEFVFPETVQTERVVVDPTDNNIIFASSIHVSEPHGLWRSDNKGVFGSWSKVVDISINDVGVDICNHNNVYITAGNELRWSVDDGITWPTGNKYGFNIWDTLNSVVACGNRIFIADAVLGSMDIIKYSSEGPTGPWTDVKTISAVGVFSRLFFDPTDIDYLVLYALHTGDGVYKSTVGTDWNLSNYGLPGCSPSCLQPTDMNFQGNRIWLTVNSGTTHGLFYSDNRASSWTTIYPQFSNTDVRANDTDNYNRIYIGTNQSGGQPYGVYYSLINDWNFQQMNDDLGNFNIFDLASAPSSNYLYAATGSGIYRNLLTAPEPTPTQTQTSTPTPTVNPNLKHTYLPVILN